MHRNYIREVVGTDVAEGAAVVSRPAAVVFDIASVEDEVSVVFRFEADKSRVLRPGCVVVRHPINDSSVLSPFLT